MIIRNRLFLTFVAVHFQKPCSRCFKNRPNETASLARDILRIVYTSFIYSTLSLIRTGWTLMRVETTNIDAYITFRLCLSWPILELWALPRGLCLVFAISSRIQSHEEADTKAQRNLIAFRGQPLECCPHMSHHLLRS